MLGGYAHIHISECECTTKVLSFVKAPEYTIVGLTQIQQANAGSDIGISQCFFSDSFVDRTFQLTSSLYMDLDQSVFNSLVLLLMQCLLLSITNRLYY